MTESPSSELVSTKLRRIAKLAREMPETAITSLSHHIDIDWLKEAWRRTRKDAAVGVDGRTAQEYEQELEVNLQSLLDRAKSGRYHAPPVRRVHIPKGKGNETRPIGIPTLEDKVLQHAVAMALEAVYEQDFRDCSWGFRPGRSAHGALEALWASLMDMHGGWLLEVDIRRFFDTLDHGRLREILRHRVRDGVVLRLIGKWLKAGVFERGNVSYPDRGTPQGGVISPLLANVYLHEVLDEWIAKRVAPRLRRGRVALVRYADDCAPRRRRNREVRYGEIQTGTKAKVGDSQDGPGATSKRLCLAAREMRVGPSEPADRGRFQTTGCCCDPMAAVVSDSEKVERDSIRCGPGRRTRVNR